MNLSITIAGVTFQNPLVLASGLLGSTGSSLARMAILGAGGVTAKSASKEPRKGHPSPVMATYDNSMINAVGLSNPGVDSACDELRVAMKDSPSPVIASLFSGSGTLEEFGEVTARFAALRPPMIEVDISCPHVKGVNFASDPIAAGKVTAIVKKNAGSVPIAIKLSPNTPHLADVAQAVERNGADVITAVNTVGPGMLINIEARAPVLGNKRGGVSGSALKPIALRCVYDIYEAVHIPIIGTGGVATGRDAIEMMMAGATAVGIGTALWTRGETVFQDVLKEIQEWMKAEGIQDIREIIGAAHQ